MGGRHDADEPAPHRGRIRSAAEARRNAEAFAAPIPAQVWADLRGEGLLDERVPAD
jgi:D-threo-aldose 1-dehydrogenase